MDQRQITEKWAKAVGRAFVNGQHAFVNGQHT